MGNNQINEIKEGTFNALTNLTKLNLNNNQINVIKEGTFNTLENLRLLNLSNNQINVIKQGTFDALTNLTELYLGNNQIYKIHKDIFKNFKQNCLLDFKDNFQINDMDFMLEFFFKIIDFKDSDSIIRKSNDRYISIYRNHSLKDQDKAYFLIKKSEHDYENRVLLFYLNLSTCKVEDIPFNSVIKTYETVLDFVITYSMIDYSFIINFKKYIDNYLKQNKQIQNLEFKLKSSKTLEHILDRDNLLLFETFFKLEIKNGENSSNKYIFDQDRFYLGINVDECFKKVLEKNNEKMAIYLFRMMSFIFKKYNIHNYENIKYKFLHDFNKNFIKTYLNEVINKKWYNLTKEILDLSKKSGIDESNFFYLIENSKFLIEKKDDEEIRKEDLKKLKQNKDNPISEIDQNLNNCSKSKSKCLISSYIRNFAKFIRFNKVDSSSNDIESGNIRNTVDKSIQNSNQANQMPSLKENTKSNNNHKNKDYDKYKDNILKLINKTKNFDLLNHETTQQILDEKYKYLPSFIYHSKLTLLLVFLIFYSINISIYYIGDTNSADLTFKSKIICYIILSIFIIIEFSQFINSVKAKSFLTYITSFKNIIESINFPLCILTLSLEDSDSKSSIIVIILE